MKIKAKPVKVKAPASQPVKKRKPISKPVSLNDDQISRYLESLEKSKPMVSEHIEMDSFNLSQFEPRFKPGRYLKTPEQVTKQSTSKPTSRPAPTSKPTSKPTLEDRAIIKMLKDMEKFSQKVTDALIRSGEHIEMLEFDCPEVKINIDPKDLEIKIDSKDLKK
ncbi:MAG: hypothetical protein ABIE74_03425 [Pseudomonadota bacterium]